jgi:hypothetical protein
VVRLSIDIKPYYVSDLSVYIGQLNKYLNEMNRWHCMNDAVENFQRSQTFHALLSQNAGGFEVSSRQASHPR